MRFEQVLFGIVCIVLRCVFVPYGSFAMWRNEGRLQNVYDRTDHALQSTFVSLVGDQVYE